MEGLLGDATDTQARYLRDEAKKLKKALDDGEPDAVTSHFAAYCRLQVNRFILVDEMLKRLCEKIRTFKETLAPIHGRLR